ncbi:Serine/threonine-protein phosphatase pgam5, mitochondrial [Desmophyllum pertusum]|uniref:Serine/threonine-protein phosphatase PGAM5, mitochondrial n=1 Tax=Desmophyllum pertusum TaxID=174260 RepID=A0A9W9ZT89_9CNID|nr:Serine/threonine-protein phosphatase pgam5, mitochondrial [Desmophyllum pertusum]
MLNEGAPVVPTLPLQTGNQRKSSFFKMGARIEAAFRKHLHRADVDQVGDSVEIYVCHGNVIRYFLCRVLQLSPEGWLRMSIGHCGITWVTIRPNGKSERKKHG